MFTKNSLIAAMGRLEGFFSVSLICFRGLSLLLESLFLNFAKKALMSFCFLNPAKVSLG